MCTSPRIILKINLKNVRNSCDKPDRMFKSVVGRSWIDIVDSSKLFEMTEPLELGSVDDLVT